MMLNRSSDGARGVAREVAATIDRRQADDVWCAECWWWNHVSLRCACDDQALREHRREAVRQLPVAPGQVYEYQAGTAEVLRLTEKEGTAYAFCRSRNGEIVVPLRRLLPPQYRLVRDAPAAV